jgi:Flp pilus assembly pilin Flp
MLFLPNEEGQALAEYALILVSVCVLVVIALGLVGVNVLRLYSDVAAAVNKLLGA